MVKEQEIDRMVKFLLYPMLVVALLLFVTVPEWRDGALIYLVMSAVGLYVSSIPRFQDTLIGLKKDVGVGLFYGILVGGGFIFLNTFSANFTLGLPSLPASLAQNVQWLIIVIMAPIVEEIWRSYMLATLITIYSVTPTTAIAIQAPLFSSLHLLAYGVALGAFDKWIELFGAFQAISGLFIAAAIVGLLFGFIMWKTQNILPSITGHGLINGFLVGKGFVIVS